MLTLTLRNLSTSESRTRNFDELPTVRLLQRPAADLLTRWLETLDKIPSC